MSIVDSFLNKFREPKPSSSPAGTLTDDMSRQLTQTDLSKNTYSIDATNWYSARPYGFKVNFRDKRSISMFLPISPSNLTINTNFATNIIPTLYGTIEEHSAVRYFDISIEGTTGIAPTYFQPANVVNGRQVHQKGGRSSFSAVSGVSAGGFFSKTLSMVNKIGQKAVDLVDGKPKPNSGVVSDKSGYVAFHNLYRMLLKYKEDASGLSNSSDRSEHPLTFFNYKDNNEYDVVVKSFVMRRSADNPMLYYYSIQLRAYNLRTVGSKINTSDYKKRLADLGLNGVDSSSALGDMKSFANSAKSILGAAAGGINILGR